MVPELYVKPKSDTQIFIVIIREPQKQLIVQVIFVFNSLFVSHSHSLKVLYGIVQHEDLPSDMEHYYMDMMDIL